MTSAELPSRQVGGHVVEVLGVDEATDLAVDVVEGRQLVHLVELEADGVALLVLGHEDQVENPHGARSPPASRPPGRCCR